MNELNYDYLIYPDYLMHHGVKGMKWGVRHDPERVGQRNRNRAAKQKLKSARKQFSKDYKSAYYYGYRHPISQYVKGSKAHAESNRRWEQATASSKKVISAKKNYRKVAGKAADRRDTAAQVLRAVGTVAAVTAASYGAGYLMANPGAAASVAKAMKTGLSGMSKNAKRGANYMKNMRSGVTARNISGKVKNTAAKHAPISYVNVKKIPIDRSQKTQRMKSIKDNPYYGAYRRTEYADGTTEMHKTVLVNKPKKKIKLNIL